MIVPNRIRRSTTLFLITLLWTAGCDPNAPEGRSRSVLVLESEVQYWIDSGTRSSDATLICYADITASATGTPDAAASLLGGTLRYTRSGKLLGQDSVLAEWLFGDARIPNGTSREGRLTLETSLPLEVELTVRYTAGDGAETGDAATSFQCGPPIPTSAPPPVIETAELTTSGPMEVGDTLEVVIEARGEGGLWQTVVDLGGDWQGRRVYAERGDTAVRRVLRLPVEPQLYGAAELTLTVLVQDILDQRATAGPLVAGPVIDTTPPVLGDPQADGDSRLDPWDLTAQWGAGDLAELRVSARDPAGVHILGYELAGPWTVTDSAVRPGGYPKAAENFFVPVDPGWLGPVELTVYARDAPGNEARVRSMPDSVRIYPVVERSVDSVTLSQKVRDPVYDPARRKFYYTAHESTAIWELDEQTLASSMLVELGDTVGALDITPGGDSLVALVQNGFQLIVVPLTGGEATRLDLGFRSAGHLAALSNGHVFVAGWLSEDSGLFEVLPGGAVRQRRDAPVGTGGLFRSGDGTTVAAMGHCTAVYRTSTDSFTPCHHGWFPGFEELPHVDRTGQRLLFYPNLYDGDLQLLWEYRPRPGLQSAVLAPSGTRAYLHTGKGLERYELDTRLVTDRSPLPPAQGPILVAPDESFVAAFHVWGTDPTTVYVTRY